MSVAEIRAMVKKVIYSFLFVCLLVCECVILFVVSCILVSCLVGDLHTHAHIKYASFKWFIYLRCKSLEFTLDTAPSVCSRLEVSAPLDCLHLSLSKLQIEEKFN